MSAACKMRTKVANSSCAGVQTRGGELRNDLEFKTQRKGMNLPLSTLAFLD